MIKINTEQLNELKGILSKMLEEVGVSADDSSSIMSNLESFNIENKSIYEDASLNEGILIKSTDWIEKTKMNVPDVTADALSDTAFAFRPIYKDNKLVKIDVNTLILNHSSNVAKPGTINYVSRNSVIGHFPVDNGQIRFGSLPTGFGTGKVTPVSLTNGSSHYGTGLTDNNNATIVNYINDTLTDLSLRNNAPSTAFDYSNPYRTLNNQTSLSLKNKALTNRLFEPNKAVLNSSLFDSGAPQFGTFHLNNFNFNVAGTEMGLNNALNFNEQIKYDYLMKTFEQYTTIDKNNATFVESLGSVFDHKLKQQVDDVFKQGVKINSVESLMDALQQSHAGKSQAFTFEMADSSFLKIAEAHFKNNPGVDLTKDHFFQAFGFETIKNSYKQNISNFLNEKGFVIDNNNYRKIIKDVLSDINNGFHNGLINGLKQIQANSDIVNTGTVADIVNLNTSASASVVRKWMPTYTKVQETLKRKFGGHGKEYVSINTPALLNGHELNYKVNLTDVTLNAFDVHTSFAKKAPSLSVLEELATHHNYNKGLILDDLNLINQATANIRNNSNETVAGLNAVLGRLSTETSNLVRANIASGNELTVSNLDMKRKAVTSNKSSFIGQGVAGDLAILNKGGDRSQQVLDTLSDFVVRNADGSLTNVTERNVLRNAGAGGVLKSGSFINENTIKYDQMNRVIAENFDDVRYKGYGSMQKATKGNVNVLALDIFADVTDKKYNAGLFTFNESAIISENVSDVLVGAKKRTGYISQTELISNLQKAYPGVDFSVMSVEEQMNFIKNEFQNIKVGSKTIRTIKPSEAKANARKFLSGVKLKNKKGYLADHSKVTDVLNEIQKLLSGSNIEKLIDKTIYINSLLSLNVPVDDKYLGYKSFEEDAMNIFKVRNKEMISEFKQLLDKRSVAHKLYKDAVAYHGSDKFMFGPKSMTSEILAIYEANIASKRSFAIDTVELIKKYEPFLKEKKAGYNKKIKHIRKKSAYSGKEERFLKSFLNSDHAKTNADLAGRVSDILEQYQNYKSEMLNGRKTKTFFTGKNSWKNIFGKSMAFEKNYVAPGDFQNFEDVADLSKLHFENIHFDESKGLFVFNFDEVQRAVNGSKLHAGSGEKFSVSTVAKKIIVDGKEFGMASSSKGFNRNFSGADISSFIKTSLHLAGNKKNGAELLARYKKSGILDLLNLEIKQTGDGYSFLDKNASFAGDDVSTAVGKLRNGIDNGYLDEFLSTKATIKRLKDKGYKHSEQVIHKLNKIYEKTSFYKKDNDAYKIFGVFDVEINGVKSKVHGVKRIQSLALSSSHGKGPLVNALKLDTFAGSFLGNVHREVGDLLKTKATQNFQNVLDAVNAVPSSVYTGAKTYEDFARELSYFEQTASNNLDGRHFLFDSHNATNLYRRLTGHGAELTEASFTAILKDAGFNEKVIYNLFSEVNGKNLNTFSYSFDSLGDHSDDYRFLKSEVARTVIDAKAGDAATDFRRSFDDFEKFMDEHFYKSGDILSGDLKKSYVSHYNSLLKNSEGIGDGGYLRSIISRANGSYDKKNIFKMFQLLKGSTEITSTATSFNAFYSDQSGNFSASNFNKVLKTAVEMKDYRTYKNLIPTTEKIAKNNRNLMAKVQEFDDLFSKGDVSELSQLDRSFLFSIGDTLEFNNPTLAASFKRSVSDYRAAYANADTPAEKLTNYFNKMAKNWTLVSEKIKSTTQYFIDKDLTTTLDSSLKRLTTSVFMSDSYELNNVTKKHTLFSDAKAVTIKNSISGKPAEGSLLMEALANRFDEVSGNAEELKAFRGDLDSFFGKQIVDDFFFEGIDLNDINNPGARTFRENVRRLENFAIVSTDALKSNGGASTASAFKNSASSGLFGKAFVGLMNRHPHQSEMHFSPNLTFLTDASKTDFVSKFLTDAGFHKNNSGMMVIGKKTALGLFGDFDGDNFYLAALDELFEKQSGVDKSVWQNKGLAQIFAFRGLSGDELKNKLATYGISGLSDDFYTELQSLTDTYNAALTAKFERVKGQHMNFMQLAFREGSKPLEAFHKSIVAKDDAATTTQKILDALRKDILYDEFQKALGGEEAVVEQIGDFLKKNDLFNLRSVRSITRDVSSTAAVMHTGGVWYGANTKRNAAQMLSRANYSSAALDSFYKAEFAKNGMGSIDEVLQRAQANGLGDSLEDLSKRMEDSVKSIRNNRAAFDKITAESIEAGVISSKHGERTVFEVINDASKYSFSDKSFVSKYDELMSVNLNSKDDVLNYLKRLRQAEDLNSIIIDDVMKALNNNKYFQEAGVRGFDETDWLMKLQDLSDDVFVKLQKKIKYTQALFTVNKGFSEIDQILDLAAEKPTGGNLTNFFKKLGLDISWSSLDGKNKTINEVLTEGSELSVSSNADNTKNIIGNSTRRFTLKGAYEAHESFVRDIDEIATVISENENAVDGVESGVLFDELAEEAQKNADELKKAVGGFDNFGQYYASNKAKVLKRGGIIGVGLLALGAFIGYNNAKNNTVTHDEDQQMLGAVPGTHDFRGPSDLGYINYRNKKGR